MNDFQTMIHQATESNLQTALEALQAVHHDSWLIESFDADSTLDLNSALDSVSNLLALIQERLRETPATRHDEQVADLLIQAAQQ